MSQITDNFMTTFFIKFLQLKKGFTLLETLTSIAILSLVIIGPLAAIINSSSYARQTKDTMVANYLAEEGVELLQNQYDSLYVFCKKQPSDPFCTPLDPYETAGQIAWRLFKSRMVDNGVGFPSCFVNGTSINPDGCSYDLVTMIGDITQIPSRYVSTDTTCSDLVDASSTILGINRHVYICKGVPSHLSGAVLGTKTFSRKVSIEWLPTFESSPMLSQYDDDLRVTSSVTYRARNGYTTTSTTTRFMHSQP